MICEGNIKLDIHVPEKDVSRSMEVFYNPIMKANRDISIALLLAFGKMEMKIALPLSGSGVRAFRFLNELPGEMISGMFVNDLRENFSSEFNLALKLNNLDESKLVIEAKDANQFLLSKIGFDYIDIDPFGSPNPFLSSSVARINRGGILAITATDTGALAGTYVKAGLRKYWARSLNCYMKHELGLRILIRKVQLQGIQFGKALIPILSYHKNHYYRVYFISSNGKKMCDEILKQHQYFLFDPKTLERKSSFFNLWEGKSLHEYQMAGPLWGGGLHDSKLLEKMVKQNIFSSEQKLLEQCLEEAKNPNVVGFIESHVLASKREIENPKMIDLLGIEGTWRTQFSSSAVKTKLNIEKLLEKLKEN